MSEQWRIETLWVWWKGAEAPSLAVAWDEYDFGENSGGFEDECRKYLESHASDITEHRRAHIVIDGQPIWDAFMPTETTGEVV